MNKTITWKLTHNSTSRNLTHLIAAAIQGKNIALIGNINGMFKTCGDSNTFFETLIKLVAKLGNRIHMYIDSETNKEMRKDRMTNRLMNKSNVIIHIVRDWTKFKIGEEMKFDVAIMNPPYGKLHIKIQDRIRLYAKKIINISPIRWLQDPVAKTRSNSEYNKYKDLRSCIESIEVIKDKEAQQLFGTAEFGMDLGISVIGNGGFDCDTLIDPIINRIIAYMIKNPAPFETNQQLGIRVRIPEIKSKGGNGSGNRKRKQVINYKFLGNLFVFIDGKKDNKPWYDWYNKNQHSKTTDYISNSIKFNSVQEATNFIDSTNTTFFKYVSYNIINDINIEANKVLWMNDYTKPWDNMRLCNYFNITGYIDDNHAVPGSEWETILEVMKQTV